MVSNRWIGGLIVSGSAALAMSGCSSRAIPAGASADEGDASGGYEDDDDDGPEPPDTATGGEPPRPTDSGDDEPPNPTTAEPPPTGGFEFEVCPDLVTESAYCMSTVYGGGLVIVGVDSGTMCSVGSLPLKTSIQSLAWVGDSVFYCELEQGDAVRLDLWSASGESVPHPCEGIVDIDGALVSTPWSGIGPVTQWFESWEALLAGKPSYVVNTEMQATRFGGGDDGLLYGAWHSAMMVERFDVVGDFGLDPLQLDVDDWINGLDRVGPYLYVTSVGSLMRVFDAESGKLVREVPTGDLNGLTCRPGI